MAVPYYGDFPTGHTGVVIPFNTFDSNDPSASVTITNLANTDVHIHKNGSLTQRASAAGIAVDIDVDAITGGHWITIDLSDDTDPGFYAAGSEISVRIEGITVDAATVNAFVGAFSIERAGGTIALLKLVQAAVITNATGVDIAADIIAMKAETALIVADTNELQTDDYPTLIAAIKTETALIVADTNELQTDNTPAAIAALDAVVDTVKVDTVAIKVITDALTAAAAAKLALSGGTIVSAAAAAGTLSTTQMTTDLTEVTNDHYNGRIIIWTSGVLQNQATDITDYDGATKMLTYTATTEAPTAADTFVIV